MKAVADTSFFIAREKGRPLLQAPPDQLAVSVVTVAELRLGVLSADSVLERAQRLGSLQRADGYELLAIDDAVGIAWSELVAQLRAMKRKIPANDSWIAATAIAHHLPVVTQDRDYDSLPGVTVIRL